MKQRDAIKYLAKRFGLRLLYVFGSTARGDRHAKSDTDIAYLSATPLTAKQTLAFSQTLQRILGASPVDLVNMASAPPLLRYLIVKEGMKLFGSAEVDDAFYRGAIKRFIDAKPLFDATDTYVRERIHL